jgi:predicted RNA-binding protein associated with RNAse of E/G family
MKTKLSILIFSVLVGLLTSCNKNDIDLNSVEFKIIGQGNLFGNGDENINKQNKVISDTKSWNELIDKMNSVNNVSESFTETNIDFQNFSIIAVFDEIKANGGYSIDVIKIVENENNIIVTLDYLLKGDDTTIMTQPYNIVKIPKDNKEIIFK